MSIEVGCALGDPVWQSRRLWSLLDMLKRYSALFGRAIWGLGDFEANFAWRTALEKGKPKPIEEKDAEFIRYYLSGILELALELDLDLVPPVVQKMQKYLSPENLPNYSTEDASKDLELLRGRVLDHLDSRLFLFIRRDRADYYVQPDQFGETVANRFSEAIDDIEGAGHCLALSEGTACVLHLMRIMEVGLKALAAPLGIPYAPSWESYLRQIQKNIDAQYASKSVDWKRDEPFLRDVSGDLVSVKQAWRNPTMHVIRKYSADEAEEIFRAVRRFMQRLAQDLPAMPSSAP